MAWSRWRLVSGNRRHGCISRCGRARYILPRRRCVRLSDAGLSNCRISRLLFSVGLLGVLEYVEMRENLEYPEYLENPEMLEGFGMLENLEDSDYLGGVGYLGVIGRVPLQFG